MSALPRNVGIPHRAAHRNVNAKKNLQESSLDPAWALAHKPKTTRPRTQTAQLPDKKLPGQNLKQTDLVEFNQAAEKSAIHYLAEHIQRKGAPSFNTACALIALELDISTETAKRYLRKYSVDHPKAPFAIENGFVTLRKRSSK
jgi:hypothetical protein